MSDTGTQQDTSTYEERRAKIAARRSKEEQAARDLQAQITALEGLKLDAQRRYPYPEDPKGYLTLSERRDMLRDLRRELEDTNDVLKALDESEGKIDAEIAHYEWWDERNLEILFERYDSALYLYNLTVKDAEQGRRFAPDPNAEDINRRYQELLDLANQIRERGYDPETRAKLPSPPVTAGGPPSPATMGTPTSAQPPAPARTTVVTGGPPSPMNISAVTRAGQSMTPRAGVEKQSAPPAEVKEQVVPPASVVVNRAEQSAYVSTQLQSRGLPDTPENRRMLRAEFRRAGRGVPEQQWMAEFQRLYPAYKEWTTDAVVQHFGQDFIDLIRKVSSGEVEYTDEEFQAALRNTQYGMRTNQYQMQFDALRPADQQNLIRVTADQIRKDYGDVEFTESQIADLARVAARSGLTGTGLRQEVYRSAFRMSEGQEVPVLRMQALRGEDAERINRVARAYGRKATDAEVRAILTGEPLNGVVLTEEGLTQRLQAEAKALFPQFADQIDAGVTLETIGDRYKKYAADLLEMPEDNIDMFSGPYLKAFGDREKGPLSLFEWQQTVKSDPTFGWQYTKQANDQATSLGLAMARAFGAIQ